MPPFPAALNTHTIGLLVPCYPFCSVRSEEEARRKMRRRRRRKREKAERAAAAAAAAAGGGKGSAGVVNGGDADEAGELGGSGAAAPGASDELGSLVLITSKHKLKSFAFNPTIPSGSSRAAQVVLGLANNSIEVCAEQTLGGVAGAWLA